MFAPYPRNDPLEYDTHKETHIPVVDPTERRCSSIKLCSHEAVARRSRRQFTCLAEDLDDQSPSIWRFLSWVAYSRKFAARSQIPDNERLCCPLSWCRQVLRDEDMLLNHVFTCAHLSDGRYWCYHCEREESFAPFQCKHCPAPKFRKERLSVKVKRLLRSLGTKAHLKDRHAFTPSATPDGTSYAVRSQYFEHLPECYGITPTAAEVENHQVLQTQPVWHDLGTVHKSGLAELNGSRFLPAELSGSFDSTSKLDDPSLGYRAIRHSANDEAAAPAPHYTSMDANQAQPLPAPPIDHHEAPSRSCIRTNEPCTSRASLPQLRSPISPQSSRWMSGTYIDTISASPTNTDSSDFSLFTKSFASDISPPSTRNSTLQSFSQSSFSSEGQHTPFDTRPILNEMPNSIPEEELTCAELASNIPIETFHSTEGKPSNDKDSRHWLTPNDLLNNFWNVLAVHVKESSERLNMLPDNPLTSHLRFITADTIAFIGFQVWQATLNGCPPYTILDLYALVHVAYACAIAVHNCQIENQLHCLFTHALSIDTRALSEEDQKIYTSIVWCIWFPGRENLHKLTSNGHRIQQVQPENGQSKAKGKGPVDLTKISGQVIQPSQAEHAPNTIESYSNVDNEIFHVLAHFVGMFGDTTFYDQTTLVVGDLSSGGRDEKFIQTIKDYVTNPLIKDQFQPGPTLEGFVEAVLEADRLVSIGQITTVHELEAGLKWFGRSASQPMELFRIFSSKVKELCNVVYYHFRQESVLQCRIEGNNAVWINLEMIMSDIKPPNPDGEHWHEACVQSSSSSFSPETPGSLPDCTANDAANEVSQGIRIGLPRRSAMKRKRLSSSSSASTPETGPSPSSSASSKTLSESLGSEFSRCSSCGFQPTGERRWHKRTMTRHMLTHVDPVSKETFLCNYQGCNSSFTRTDNLTTHVRVVHQRNKRHCSSYSSFGNGGVKLSTKINGHSGSYS